MGSAFCALVPSTGEIRLGAVMLGEQLLLLPEWGEVQQHPACAACLGFLPL